MKSNLNLILFVWILIPTVKCCHLDSFVFKADNCHRFVFSFFQMRTWSSGYTFNWFSPYGKQVVVKSCTFQFLQLCHDDKNSSIFYLSKNNMTTFPVVATLLCETIFKKHFDPNHEQISELWSNSTLLYQNLSYRYCH